VLGLELIADDFFWAKKQAKKLPFDRWLRYMRKLGSDKSPTWVAKLGVNSEREFIQGVRDYSRANRNGSRGIYAYYALSAGVVYEINERYKLIKVRRYFILVQDGEVCEISGDEA